jgi:tetratricopeptide (TPR) repeat protein
MAMRHDARAAELLDQVIAREPEVISLFVLRAWAEVRSTGSLERARAFLDQVPKGDAALVEIARMERDYPRYRAALEQIRPTNRRSNLGVWSVLAGFAERQLGNEEVARLHFEDAANLSEEMFLGASQTNRAAPIRGLALAHLGRTEEALAIARSLPRLLEPDDHWTGARMGEIHAQILTAAGAVELAVRQIERVLQTQYSDALSLWQLRLDPIWDPLRGNPEFEKLIAL